MAGISIEAEKGAAERSRSYRTLDILRGIAAISVVILHYPQAFAPISAPGAYLAVDLFFAMSGFVLANSYDAKLYEGMRASAFLCARIIRLFPFYLVALLPGTVELAYFYRHEHLEGAVAISSLFNAFILPVPPVGIPYAPLFPANFVAWTLFFELVVNGIYATTIRWLSSRRLLLLITACGFMLVIIAVVRGNLNGGAYWSDAYLALLRVMFSFFLGVLIFRRGAAGRLRPLRVPTFLLVGVALLALGSPIPSSARGVTDGILVILIFPLLVAAATSDPPQPSGWIDRLFGDISYPLYVLQIPVFSVLVLGAARISPDLLRRIAPWGGLVTLGLLCGVILFTVRLVEAPFRRQVSRRAASVFQRR